MLETLSVVIKSSYAVWNSGKRGIIESCMINKGDRFLCFQISWETKKERKKERTGMKGRREGKKNEGQQGGKEIPSYSPVVPISHLKWRMSPNKRKLVKKRILLHKKEVPLQPPFPFLLCQHLQPLDEVLLVSPTITAWFTARIALGGGLQLVDILHLS